MATIQQIEKEIRRKSQYMATKESKLKKEVLKLQSELFALIGEKYLPAFALDAAGNLKNTAGNIKLANDLDKIFDLFNNEFQKDVLRSFGGDLLGVVPFIDDYYNVLEIKKTLVDSAIQSAGFIQKSIGLTNKGNFIKGGYLDTLSKNAEVRQELKNYVLNSLSSKKPLKDYAQGFRALVKGIDRVSGKLDQYYRQFAYDTYNQVDEAVNFHVANQLKLKAFKYVGGVIKTTRPFCITRNNKVYTIKEAEKWNHMTPWKGAIKPLNFMIDRGGYNCRHMIAYITDAMAIRSRPELEGKL